MKSVLFALVQNEPMALMRVVRLLARHGISLESLSVKACESNKYLKVTVVPESGKEISDQIVKFLDRLIDVVEVKRMEEDVASQNTLTSMYESYDCLFDAAIEA